MKISYFAITHILHCFHIFKPGQNAPGQPVFESDNFGVVGKAYDNVAHKYGSGWIILWSQKNRVKLADKQILKAPQ
jgi:hypothetical protein